MYMFDWSMVHFCFDLICKNFENCLHRITIPIQWNLSKADTIGTNKKLSIIERVSSGPGFIMWVIFGIQ